MIDTQNFYINGEWVKPTQPNPFPVINPSTETVCANISLGGQADTDKAVNAARTALPIWKHSSKEQRLDVLQQLLDIYTRRYDEMVKAISTEMGAPHDLSKNAQAMTGIGHIKNTMRALRKFEFITPLGSHAADNQIVYEAVGTLALITPWNWPVSQIALKVIPAIAAGCTMVLKPSEIAPLSALLIAEMIDETDLPAGVFNLVNGDGSGVGTQLSTHPDIDLISFTGSTRAGIQISKNAAATLKKVGLELGGKGANIIFADADKKAVKRGVLHCFNNTGQSCNAPTRMLVERTVYDEAVEQAKATAELCKVDIASKEGRHIGPLVSAVQFDKVQALIQKGIDEGARLVIGGTGKPEGLDKGYFVRPTIFADVNNDMNIAREEIFGPVLVMIPFDSEAEAISIANDTPYGLTNYVQTQDMERAQRITKKLDSGMVEINGASLGGGAPFGGVKQSGNCREGGTWGLEEFLEVKAVSGWSIDS